MFFRKLALKVTHAPVDNHTPNMPMRTQAALSRLGGCLLKTVHEVGREKGGADGETLKGWEWG